MKVKLISGFIFAAFAFWLGAYYVNSRVVERIRIQEDQARMREEMRGRSFTAQDELWSRARVAKTVDDWEQLRLSVAEVEDPGLKKIITAKLLERNFWRAEELLLRARSLLEIDKNNPVAHKYLREAKDIYARMGKYVGNSAEADGNQTWEARLNYLKGVYYFRALIFVEDPQKNMAIMVDLVSRSANHLKKVFEYSPKDWTASVALEILQEKAKNISSGSDNFQRQLQLLPQREAYPFGVMPPPEGRH